MRKRMARETRESLEKAIEKHFTQIERIKSRLSE